MEISKIREYSKHFFANILPRTDIIRKIFRIHGQPKLGLPDTQLILEAYKTGSIIFSKGELRVTMKKGRKTAGNATSFHQKKEIVVFGKILSKQVAIRPTELTMNLSINLFIIIIIIIIITTHAKPYPGLRYRCMLEIVSVCLQ